MNITMLSIIALTATAATATANPAEPSATTPKATSPAYVAAGGIAGIESVFFAGVVLEGAVRLGSSIHARAALELGGASTVLSGGTYQGYRMGLEARRCGRIACIAAGIDVGIRHVQLVHEDDLGGRMEEELRYPIVVPSAGLELGSRVRARFAFALPTAIGEYEMLMGIGISAGVGYAF